MPILLEINLLEFKIIFLFTASRLSGGENTFNFSAVKPSCG